MQITDPLPQLDPYAPDMLELLFDRIPMGIAVLDPDFRLLRYNATWGDFCRRNSPATAAGLQPGSLFFDILPLSRPSLEPLLQRALKGETVRELAFAIPTAMGLPYCNVLFAPLAQAGDINGILVAGTVVTEQVEARQALQNALHELQLSHEAIEQRVDSRTRELTTLMTVQQALTSSLKLKEVLQVIAREARRITHTDVGAVFLPDKNNLVLAVLSSDDPIDIEPGYRISLTDSVTGTAFSTGRTQLVADISSYAHIDPNARTKAGLKSLLAVPLVSGTRTIGVLSVGNKVGGDLGEEDERLLTMMAPSAVIALENVHVYEQASEAAVAAERGRLARDLHDAVTQTLFSASLTAEVLPRIWARNPDEGMARLEKLRELTRGALAEMRTLLLELRPAALTEMPLPDLLRQLVEGIAGRTRINITVTVTGDHDPNPDVKIAAYRIAQEALNNVAKHSKAQHAGVVLALAEHSLTLTISDDGVGFDPAANRANHLGLRIMAERAEAMNGHLNIETTSGQGTEIRVSWSEMEG